MNYLYRISLEADGVFSKWHRKNVPPLYYVSDSKHNATKWAESNLKEGVKVKTITRLAEQLSSNLFTGNIKE